MANLADVERFAQVLERKVGKLLGTSVNATYEINNDLQIAGAAGSVIGFDRKWLKNASNREVKGALAHELAHVGTFGSNASEKVNESLGDAVRSRLGFGPGEGYTYGLEERFGQLDRKGFRQVAERMREGEYSRGVLARQEDRMANATGPRVPGQNKPDGRMRNTFANTISKNTIDYSNPGGASALPSLDPAQTANYYNQLGALYSGYQNQLVGLKQQRLGARADFRTALSQIRGEKVAGLAATESDAIERGVTGSSSDLVGRTGVEGAAQAARQMAASQRDRVVQQTHLEREQAGIDYFQNVQALEADKLAAQQALLAQQLEQNLIISGQETTMDALKAIYEAFANRTGGGGGGGGGQPAAPIVRPPMGQPGSRLQTPRDVQDPYWWAV